MAKRRTKVAKKRAELKVSKRAAMARGDQSGNQKSKYRERRAARNNGAPMAARSRAPWWSGALLAEAMRANAAEPRPLEKAA